jgi:hypothetical protein
MARAFRDNLSGLTNNVAIVETVVHVEVLENYDAWCQHNEDLDGNSVSTLTEVVGGPLTVRCASWHE